MLASYNPENQSPTGYFKVATYKLKEFKRFSLKQFYLIVEPDKVQRLPTKWNENPDGLFSGLKQKKIALS